MPAGRTGVRPAGCAEGALTPSAIQTGREISQLLTGSDHGPCRGPIEPGTAVMTVKRRRRLMPRNPVDLSACGAGRRRCSMPIDTLRKSVRCWPTRGGYRVLVSSASGQVLPPGEGRMSSGAEGLPVAPRRSCCRKPSFERVGKRKGKDLSYLSGP